MPLKSVKIFNNFYKEVKKKFKYEYIFNLFFESLNCVFLYVEKNVLPLMFDFNSFNR